MKILITGLGITGKSTLRRRVKKGLKSLGLSVVHYDADEFKELRDEADRDCSLKLPKFEKGVVYLIEDIHATGNDAVLPLGDYDLIIYIKTGLISHILFWLPRIVRWFQSGNFAWDQKKGWLGTGRPYDLRNIIPMIREFCKDFQNRKKWLAEDMEVIRPHRKIFIQSRWTWRGPKFRLDI